MTGTRRISIALPLVAVLAVTGCMSGGGSPISRTPIVVSQPSGVEGSWVDANGVGVSNFAGGVFETVASDTGNKLAEGSYRYANQTTVEISLTSLIQQQSSTVNCALVSTSQLNCTSSSGSQFVLTRRA